MSRELKVTKMNNYFLIAIILLFMAITVSLVLFDEYRILEKQVISHECATYDEKGKLKWLK
jgi:hypothetical protein